METRNTFTKDERLCSKTEIDRLFVQGNSVFEYPLKFIYLPSNRSGKHPVQIVFSVPKKNFKHAVKRNLIRRRMREAYRLNKHLIYDVLKEKETTLSIMVIYVEKEVKDYSVIEKGIIKGIKKITRKINAQIGN